MQRARGRSVSAQDAVGYTGCELDLEPKAFFLSLFWRSLGREERKSCAKVSLWQERCFPVDLCLSRSLLPYFFHGRECICRVSEPEITLFIALPPCPTAFQSFQPHQSQFYFEYERGFERDFRACPSRIALWRVRRGREAGSGSTMLWLHWCTRGEPGAWPLLLKALNPGFCLMTVFMSKQVSGAGQRRQVCFYRGKEIGGTFSEGLCWGVRHERVWTLPLALPNVSWYDLL